MLSKLFGFIEKHKTVFFIIGYAGILGCASFFFVKDVTVDIKNFFAHFIRLLFTAGITTLLFVGFFTKRKRLYLIGFLLFAGFLMLGGLVTGSTFAYGAGGGIFGGGVDARDVLFYVFRFILAVFFLAYTVFFVLNHAFGIRKVLFVERLFLFMAFCAAFVYYIFSIVYATMNAGQLWPYFFVPLFFMAGIFILPVSTSIIEGDLELRAKKEKAAKPAKEEKEEKAEKEPKEEPKPKKEKKAKPAKQISEEELAEDPEEE